jgi:phosphate starvation-inducible PhoH-like protein
LKTAHYSQIVVLSPEDNTRLLSLCGKYDEHVRLIEERLGVDIKQRGFSFSICGHPHAVKQASETLTTLYKEHHLALKQVHLFLQTLQKNPTSSHRIGHSMEIRTKRGTIVARGENQVNYIKNIMNHDISFGIGPAGTGKTYLAVASAVNALETERVNRIILVRPIVEAGEKLGFLPGDLAEKVHPYLRPIYDALYEMLGFDQVKILIERNIIEIAPLAYMRGRSLNDAYWF